MDASFGVRPSEHMPGKTIHNYLTQYAAESNLLPHIQFRTKVLTASRLQASGWRLVTCTNGKSNTLTCAKLMLATGLTSQPLPLSRVFSSTKASNIPILTFRTYAMHTPLLHTSPTVYRVLVYGSGKATHDVVNLLASSGKHASWVIRPSCHGATYMCHPHLVIAPFGNFDLINIGLTRFTQWLGSCIWGNADGFGWIRWVLHGTPWGRAFIKAYWDHMGKEIPQQGGLRADDKTKALIPRQSILWYGAGTSFLNYPEDFYGFVRSGLVETVERDVKAVEESGQVVFGDGSEVKVDAVICSTGWDWAAGMNFEPKDFTPSQRELWEGLEKRADREILARFPMLKDGPKSIERDADADAMTGWRLWRGIAPPSLPGPPDVVFLGMMLQLQTAVRSEIIALWAYAYLYGKMKVPVDSIAEPSRPISVVPSSSLADKEEMLYDTALFNRFGKWRTPYGMGWRNPDFMFDGIPYFDMLLKDLELRYWRKGWGWVGEVFGGRYAQKDYKGLVEERMDLQGERE